MRFSCEFQRHASTENGWEPARTTEALLVELRRREIFIDQHRAYWFMPPMVHRLTPQTKALTEAFVAMQHLEIKYEQHRLQPKTYSNDDVLHCAQTTMVLVARLASSKVMYFLSDGISLRVSRMGTILFIT
jgi:hypothetical protein